MKSDFANCLPGRKESKCKDPAQGEDGQPDGEPHKGRVLPAQAQLFQVPASELLYVGRRKNGVKSEKKHTIKDECFNI